MRTVLIVAAHPDDEILGVGGTVARHTAEGDVVYALILGEGQTSRSAHREDTGRDVVEELHRNTLESARAVGFREVFFADFPDNRFDDVDLLDIVKAVEQKIRELQPQIVYTHYSGDLNVDHQYTARAVSRRRGRSATTVWRRYTHSRRSPRQNGILITVHSRRFVRTCLWISQIIMFRRSRR